MPGESLTVAQISYTFSHELLVRGSAKQQEIAIGKLEILNVNNYSHEMQRNDIDYFLP